MEINGKWLKRNLLPELFIMFKRHAYICILHGYECHYRDADKECKVYGVGVQLQVEVEGLRLRVAEINIHTPMSVCGVALPMAG